MKFTINDIIENDFKGITDYARYVYTEAGVYYHSSNEVFLYFCKSAKSEKPELSMEIDSNDLININSNTRFYTLVYSYSDFNRIADCNFDEIQKKLGNEIDTIIDDFANGVLRNKVILSNEGTGKSKAVLDRIKPGHIYSAPDKAILLEKEGYLDKIGKEYMRFYSNGDIIYTVINENRGNTKKSQNIAEEIVNEYIKSFDTSNIYVDAKKVNSLIEKYEGYIKEDGIDNFLSKIDDMAINDLSSNKENIISLLAFLDGSNKIQTNEKIAILEFHKFLIGEMFRGKKIITCTTHKLKILLKKMNYARNLLVFSDEIVPDVHGNANNLNNYNKYYGFLYGFAKAKEYNCSDKNTLNNINLIKKKRGVKDWTVISSYNNPSGGHNTLIELKDDNWKKVNNFSMIILSTEEKCKFIFPDFKIIDLRHYIKSDELTFLVIDGLNKKESDRFFKGNSRPIITKSVAQKFFNIEDDFFIGDGIGNTLSNKTFNHTNVKGRNTFIEKLKKKDSTNIGITLMNPHPEAINLIKGYIYNANYNRINKESKTPNEVLMDFEEEIISIIGTDQLNQSIGRSNGYRFTSKSNKTYVIINSNMMKRVNPFYYTEKVFKLTRFRNSKWLRETFPNEYKFLEMINTLLKIKEINIPELNDIENIPDKILEKLSKIIESKIDMKYPVTLFSIFKLFKVNLQRLIVVIKSKLNRISYIPHSIPDIVRYLRCGFNKGFSELFPDNKLIEILSNMYTIIKSKYKGIHVPRTRDIKSAYADFYLILEKIR